MANVDAPHGLTPHRYMNGAPYNGAATLYQIAAGYGTALFIGDPVDLVGTTDATGKYPTISKPTLADGNYTIGPIVGFQETPAASLERIYSPASTLAYAWVADDPQLIFSCQVDSAGTIGIADFGLNGILIETHSGDTSTGLSGLEFDEDSATADASNMLMLLKLVDREDNELALHADVEVLISMHRLGFSGSTDGRLGK